MIFRPKVLVRENRYFYFTKTTSYSLIGKTNHLYDIFIGSIPIMRTNKLNIHSLKQQQNESNRSQNQ